MPVPQLNSFAEKSGKKLEDVERYWEEAKKQAEGKFKHGTPQFWAYVSGIVKKRCGLKESLTFKEMILLEMTMKAGSLEPALKQIFDQIIKDKDLYKHVGDIEKIHVNLKDNVYLLTTDSEDVGFAQVKIDSENVEIQNVYFEKSFRGNQLLAKFIWFLKSRENYKKVYLGGVHSQDTVESIKRLAQRFDTFWEKDGTQVKYDPAEINKYYSLVKDTGWRVVFEHEGDYDDSWPRFYDKDPKYNLVKYHYDWLVEDISHMLDKNL